MYAVFQNGKELGEGTLTECIDFIACQLSQFNPEQVTQQQAVATGYRISKA